MGRPRKRRKPTRLSPNPRDKVKVVKKKLVGMLTDELALAILPHTGIVHDIKNRDVI